MPNISKGSRFTDLAGEAEFKPHPLLQILIFFAQIFVFMIIQTFFQIPLFAAVKAAGASDVWYTAASLLSTAVPAVLTVLYCTKAEKRSLESMGIKRENFAKNYLMGAVIGFAAFSLSLLICVTAGAARYSGTNFSGYIPYLIVIALCWGIQGAEEEILCRGWLMPSLAQRLPLWAAVIGNAAVFSLLHIFNDGFSLLAFVNIFVVGIAFSLIAVRFDSIIPSCAFHSVWNAVQGNFYGLPVSGGGCDKSVFVFTLSDNMEILNGGVFGIEGGIAVTAVMTAIIIVCIILFVNNKDNQPNV
ncbi:MAG: CPBP family intramembrane metalloprotease [Ruminococcus sp.]|nr:CPBP family intramembrane metalloprotease [Ruminococcus sp.]